MQVFSNASEPKICSVLQDASTHTLHDQRSLVLGKCPHYVQQQLANGRTIVCIDALVRRTKPDTQSIKRLDGFDQSAKRDAVFRQRFPDSVFSQMKFELETMRQAVVGDIQVDVCRLHADTGPERA